MVKLCNRTFYYIVLLLLHIYLDLSTNCHRKIRVNKTLDSTAGAFMWFSSIDLCRFNGRYVEGFIPINTNNEYDKNLISNMSKKLLHR